MNPKPSRFNWIRAIGVAFPLASVLVVQATHPVAAQSCVFTKGYWTTHADSWPVESLVLGNAANANHTYTQGELLTLLNLNPARDASLNLAGQLIAAKLNVASGSNPAPVAESLARADALLGAFPGRLPYRITPNTPVGSDMVSTARILEAYNSGEIEGSCGIANRAPIASAGPDQSAAIGSLVTLDGSGSSDPDGLPLTFHWSFVSRPAASQATLSDASAVMPTFVLDVPGTYEVQLVVNDGFLDSAPDTVLVSNVSRPIANAGPDQTTPLMRVVQLDGSGSTDLDGDPLTFAWTILSSPAGSAAALSDSAAMRPTFIADVHGDYVIQLIVSDGTFASVPDIVQVSTINSPPTANAGADQTAFVGDIITLNGSGSSDVDGNPLTYQWSLVSGPDGSAAALSDPTAVNPSFVVDRAGTYVVQLIVNDGTVDSDADTVIVTTLNSRPVANAGADQTVFVGATVELDGSGSSDVDGNPLTYHWSLTTVPAGSAAVLSDPFAVRPTFVVDSPGDYVAQLIVNDGAIDSLADTVTVSTLNRPPTANAGADQTVARGAIVSLDATGSSDPDGDPLTFRWALTSIPAGSAAALSDPASAAPTFVADLFGTYVAQLIVNDGSADSAPDTVAISTENSVPVASAGPDQTVATGATVQLDGSASFDPDGTPLQFFWSLTSQPAGSIAVLSTPTIASPTFIADLSGTYIAQLIVGDGVHHSEPDTVAITVQNGADLLARFILVPSNPPVGSSVSLHAEVLNNGPANADNVTAVFQLPAGYTYLSHSFSSNFSGGSFTYDPASGTWAMSSVPTGRLARVTVSARVNPTGPYDLTSSVTGSNVPDPDFTNNTATATITPNPNADLRVAPFNLPSGTLAVGTSVSWAIDIRNDGPATTAGVTVQHLVPAGYTITSAIVDFGGPYDAATGIWNLGSLGQGGLGRLRISARVNATGPTGLAVTITHSDQPDPNAANNSIVAPPINRPPVANAGPDQSASAFATAVLDGTQSSDPEGDALTVQWTFDLRPVNSAATLANSSTFTPTFVPDQGGSYIARLTVTDPSGASGTDTVTITAAVLNHPPVIRSLPNTIASVGQPYRYDVQATDQDAGDTLAFSLLTAPVGMTIDGGTGVVDWVPADAQAGPQSVTVQVQDSAGLSATQRFAIQVSSPSNQAPSAGDDAYEVRVNESLGVASPGVLQNDTDESPLRARLLSGPVNGTLLLNEDGSFVYTPHTQQAGELVMAENVNLAARLPGVRLNVSGSSFHGSPCGRPECATDENLATSWSSGTQAQPFFEVEFPQDVVATEIHIVGHRSTFLQTLKVTAGIFQVFAADGTELYNSGNVELAPPTRDARVRLNRIERVRRVRFSPTDGDGGSVLSRGFAEFKVIGSALIRRELVRESNVARFLPSTVRASSVFAPNIPEAVIDETSANWYAATANAGEFVQIDLPREATITRIESANPSGRPDGFGTSLPINCFGRFTLLDASGAVLFDSGQVNTPTGALNPTVTFSLDTGTVQGVRSVRYTSEGCSGFPIGFSEIRVFGSVEVDTPAFSLARKFHALARREVHSTPVVVNLTDDNGDGLVDVNDVPDVLVVAETVTNQLRGHVIAMSGDDGRELFTAGGPDLVSPWSEPAAADLDGDGLPEIVAVHSDGNHLIAFDHTGAIKWLSDAHQMPRYVFMTGTGNIVTFMTGAVSIANLDRTGAPEIVIGASVFDANGHLLGDGRTLGGTTGSNVRSSVPVVADIDLDGMPEIVAGPAAYRLSGGALSRVWLRTDRTDGYAALANLDDDPQAEAVIVANGAVYVLNHDGSDAEVWNTPSHAPVSLPGGGQGGAPLIVDVDGDGRPEIGIAASTNYVLFNRDGSIRWQTVIRDRSSHSTGSIAFDFDGDGQVEIVYRDEFFLRVYRGSDGVLLAKTPIGSSTWAEEPVVADVDNDGHADLVVTSDYLEQSAGEDDTGVIVLQDVANRWMRTRRIWNQHAYHVTNANEDASVPLDETPHWLFPGLNSFRTNAFVPGERADRSDSFTYVATDGVLQSNVATVHIAIRTPNGPPLITSTAPTTAAHGVLYTYAAIASDPDPSDILTFSLPQAPAGMTIDPSAGFIQWTPTDAQLGAHTVIVKVQDLRGLFALQEFTVAVEDPVAVPDVVGDPQADAVSAITTAGFGVGALSTRHSPTVPVGHVISQSPAGGTLVAPGSAVNLVLSLGPAPAGTVPEVVGMPRASAEADLLAAGFAVGGVTGQNHATVPANIVLSQTPAGGTTATSGSAVSLVVSLGPPPAEIDFDGDGFTGNQGDCNDGDPSIHPGAIDVPGDGIDQNCNGVDSISGDATAPIAILHSPDDLAVVTMPTDISGSVSDANLLRYTVSLAEVDATNFVTIGSGTTPITDGVLGRLDPTLLENGLYRVRLVAEDVNGQATVAERVYRIDGMTKIGNFRLSFTDLSIPVAGIPITIERTYDSRVKTREDFGVGWTLDIKRGMYRHNRTPGQGWIIRDQPFLGDFLPCIGGSLETRSHLTEVRLSDRESYTFALSVDNGNLGFTGACEGVASFRFISGTRPGAMLEILDGTGVIYLRGGPDDVLDMNAFLEGTVRVYDPRRVRLTTLDGRRIEFDRTTGITRIEDLNGNTLSITGAGIVHSSGKSISFTRDLEGRITRIVDPRGGVLEYEYGDTDDLMAVLDQGGNRTTFSYDTRHYLLDVQDPLGRRPVRAEYDADGRLIAVTDANGQRTTMDHDLTGRQELVTDRLGHVTTYTYDERGNVIRRVDALGNITTSTYDGRDNVLTETDELGNVRSYSYDADDNRLTETDALGQTTSYTYNARGQLLSETDALGGTKTRTYDSLGNLSTERDALGNVTRFTYDPQGNVITIVDALGGASRFAYDTSGNQIQVADQLGNTTFRGFDANGNRVSERRTRSAASGVETVVTSYGYDALNRLTTFVDAEGGQGRIVFNAAGQVAQQIDSLGRITSYEYDELDQLVRTTLPNGAFEAFTYDAGGRRITQTDRASRTTQFVYDAIGRLVTTTAPDGTSRRTAYDAATRRMSATNELGAITTFGYDANGRNTSIVDAVGGRTTLAYDAVGNLIARTDRNNQTTQFQYDLSRRRIRTIFPDGSSSSVTYDGLGRQIATTDPAGNTTRFEYDALGNLRRVIDALNGETRYIYDALNYRISQTDPLGNITSFSYDRLGRLLTRRLPLGQVETRTYDLAGNLRQIVDFNGQTIRLTYDAINRLTQRMLPDGVTHEFTYTPMDKIAAFRDQMGVTTIAYDLRDRPVAVTRPDGVQVAYEYDAVGNRIAVSVAGARTQYSYDAADRLRELIDGSGGRTTFGYDAHGNQTRIGYANGIETTYAYDTLNRLTAIAQHRGTTLLRSYTYTLGLAGNRTRVVEDDGRIVAYSYDALFRLTEERVTPAGGGSPSSVVYSYDSAGNRVGMLGPTGLTTYTYDANNRLVSAGGITYAYDNNGNLTAEYANGVITTYEFNALNQLVRSTAADGASTEYAYDGFNNLVHRSHAGNRVSYVLDLFGPLNPARRMDPHSVTSEQCCSPLPRGTGPAPLDGTPALSQLLRETDSAGNVLADYTYGGPTLISQRRPDGTAFYLHDGQLSTRMLADASGVVTDRYDYDAFGNLVRREGSTANPFLYNAQFQDPNLGFYLLRARNYDPRVGRFTEVDPFSGDIFDPPSLHPYMYVANDPINKADPSGEYTIGEAMATSAVIGVVTGLSVGGYTYHVTRSAKAAATAGLSSGLTAFWISSVILTGGATAAPGAAAPAVGGASLGAAPSVGGISFLSPYQFAVQSGSYMRVLFQGLVRVTNYGVLPEVLQANLVRATTWGIANGPFACALLHGVRLGYAAGLTLADGAVPFDNVLGGTLVKILDQIGYVCPPKTAR